MKPHGPYLPQSHPKAQALFQEFLAVWDQDDERPAEAVNQRMIALTGRRIPPYNWPAPATRVPEG